MRFVKVEFMAELLYWIESDFPCTDGKEFVESVFKAISEWITLADNKDTSFGPSFQSFLSLDSSLVIQVKFVQRVKPLVCHEGTNLSIALFQPKLGTWPLTCSPRCQDQHPGQLRHSSAALTASPLNIDDTVTVLFIVLGSFRLLLKKIIQQTGTCLAGFNCIYIPVWRPVYS